MATADMADVALDTTMIDKEPAKVLATQFDQLKASATQQYSLKNYGAAADFYSAAAEVQDELNGEMSPQNADVLYQYGRCLYHLAVSNSDVLGGKVASTNAEEPKRKKRKVAPTENSAAGATNGVADRGLIGDAVNKGEQKIDGNVAEAAVESKNAAKPGDSASPAKPFFQITGDENWTDSEDEDEADAQAEEEEDDFAIAFEILDVARVLLSRKLEVVQDKAGKGSSEPPEARQLKERLADTLDLQAEISLENERYHDAIKDTRDALALKLNLYPTESGLIAEAHFKLSIALEFASVTSTTDGTDDNAETKPAQVDETLRNQAAEEMEKAIASCNLRITKEEASLPTIADDRAEQLKKSCADVRDMVADMEQRLLDLRNPAATLSGGMAPDGSDPLRGVLGAMMGESKGQQKQLIAQATEKANDLSGLVKKKKVLKVEEASNGAAVRGESKGKRKAEDGEVGKVANGKKAKVEDAV
ncbi:hypothetical protein LTR08_005865 [Meristemomyces frigidus]|nr:hypothetical protein LTR08_005865 [Meristemomyces frigidus]